MLKEWKKKGVVRAKYEYLINIERMLHDIYEWPFLLKKKETRSSICINTYVYKHLLSKSLPDSHHFIWTLIETCHI